MLTPESYAAFTRWLEAEIALAEARAREWRDHEWSRAWRAGELAALKHVKGHLEDEPVPAGESAEAPAGDTPSR